MSWGRVQKTRRSKQCNSLIWIIILVLICYRKGRLRQRIFSPTSTFALDFGCHKRAQIWSKYHFQRIFCPPPFLRWHRPTNQPTGQTSCNLHFRRFANRRQRFAIGLKQSAFSFLHIFVDTQHVLETNIAHIKQCLYPGNQFVHDG